MPPKNTAPSTIVLRSLSALSGGDAHDFKVKVPPSALPDGPFALKLISATFATDAATADFPVSIHCTLGAPSRMCDTWSTGASTFVGSARTLGASTTEAPEIACSGAFNQEEVRVTIRLLTSMGVATGLTATVLVFTVRPIE
jgi:hypothetical protein